MLFNSYEFIFAFLPAFLCGFFLLRAQRLRLALLVATGYAFYAFGEPWFPCLMVATTAISFVTGILVEEADEQSKRRKVVLGLGIAGVLGLLAYFKYADLAATTVSDAVRTLTGTGLPSLTDLTRGIALPIAISFYTFEAISYMVDVHRRTIPAERDPLAYAAFIAFFPKLVAGPIIRYAELRPQLDQLVRFDVDRFGHGLLLFALGLGEKVLLADQIATRINHGLDHPGTLGLLGAWSGMVGFSFQIFFDFAAYTLMARGVSRMVGIELPPNFDRPYMAVSPRDFWRRWHISLSRWLRDYLYIPLGGNRGSRTRRDMNLLATMGLGGLWHGAAAHFVIWGGYHGGLLIGDHRLSKLKWRPPRVLAIGATFVAVLLGWVLFRMPSLGASADVYRALLGASGTGRIDGSLLPFLGVSAVLMWGTPEEIRWRIPSWGTVRLAAVGVMTAIALVTLNASQTFIYFKF